MTTYYIDSVAGDDGNVGSEAAPWETFTNISWAASPAGTQYLFKRGGTYPGGLGVNANGASGNPIIIDAYGTGDDPIFTMTGTDPGDYGKAILFWEATYWTVRHIHFDDCPYNGIGLAGDPGSRPHHIVIEDCTFSECGIGIEAAADNIHITGCTARDGTMIVNTVGGDDDYGALGIVVDGDDFEIDNCNFLRLRAVSEDYNYDGGAIEVYATANRENLYVHDNYVEDCEGFMEFGGSDAPTFDHIVVTYNTLVDSLRPLHFNLPPYGYGITITDMLFAHNTLIESESGESVVNFVQDDIDDAELILRNNVCYGFTKLGRIFGSPDTLVQSFTHEYNVWYPMDDQSITLGLGESIEDPDLDAEYVPTAGSPCLGSAVVIAGIDQLSLGAGPDIGAYEAPAALDTTRSLYYRIADGDADIYIDNTTRYGTAAFLSIGNYHDTIRSSGLLFAGVTIPAGVTIESAIITYTAYASLATTTVNSIITAVDAAAPEAPATYAAWAALTPTTASVDWDNIPAWTDGSKYDTPDLSPIVSKLHSSYDYSEGSSMYFMHKDDGSSYDARRGPSSFEHSPAEAAVLHIVYTLAADAQTFVRAPMWGRF